MIEGERILGRFTVGERIGGGGYGTVHRAWDERLQRAVAVKAVEGEAAGRVLREAHAAARLNHRGIVTLYELGEENGCTYLVSELIVGSDLRLLAARGAVSDRDVAEIGAELCAALAHAHSNGVVHRDVKPENIVVRSGRPGHAADGSGLAMLADFGIASVLGAESLTATGQVVGTLAYMAPEQAAGESPSGATDVYALALTLYELWSGANPVHAATPAATARRIGEPVESLAEARPELPEALAAVIDSCLSAEPEDRPEPSALREALLGARSALHPERPVPEPAGSEQQTPLPAAIPARPFAVLLAAGAIAVLGLIVGVPGLALLAAALLAPAALLIARPRDWLLPALAPLLGLLGLAPVFVVIAAAQSRSAARPALAALGWAWTGIAAAVLGAGLGVVDPPRALGWAASGPDALDGAVAPLLAADPVATGLIWIGAAVLLGIVLDVAGAALAAVLGLLWTALLIAALGAVGGPAAPAALLAPALLAAIGVALWDRLGRPQLGGEARGTHLPAPIAALGALLAPREDGERAATAVRPRNPASAPLPNSEIRASRAATRHVRAALHGAGSRSGLP